MRKYPQERRITCNYLLFSCKRLQAWGLKVAPPIERAHSICKNLGLRPRTAWKHQRGSCSSSPLSVFCPSVFLVESERGKSLPGALKSGRHKALLKMNCSHQGVGRGLLEGVLVTDTHLHLTGNSWRCIIQKND